MSTQPNNYELVIQPRRSWFHVDWRELLHYRDLLYLLVRRDFVAQYKQTVLGPMWFILQPLLTTLVFTVIFGRVAKIPTDGLPPLLFYLCGMLAWNYFSGCLGATSITFLTNAAIFGKVYIPLLIVPLSVVISKLIGFAIQLATFLCFLAYYKLFTAAGGALHPGLGFLLLPLLLLQSAATSLGVGFWISALTTKYRDFVHVSSFLTQLWMYGTPVVFPLSVISEKWRWVICLNPMTGVVELYRYCLLGVGTVDPGYTGLSVLTSVVLLLSGLFAFTRAERTFIDTV